MIDDEATLLLAEQFAPEPNGMLALQQEIQEKLISAGWAPPARVWLEGDDIPSHIPVIDLHGEVRDDYQDYDEDEGEVYGANYDVVEMNIDREAAIEREKARRGVQV